MVEYTINDQINADTVVLITNEGEKLGNYQLQTALAKAYAVNLDLVCINNNCNPPICKMMNYSKYKYDTAKRERLNRAKQHEAELKEIQLRPQIDKHDADTKINKCREELSKGNKIKIVISFKGRQIDRADFGFELLNRFKSALADISTIYKDGKLDGKRIECILVPKK